MIEKKNNRTGKNQLLTRMIFFVGVIIFLLIISSLIKEILNRRAIDREILDYQQQIQQVQQSNQHLSQQLADWQQSNQLEMNARLKLNLEKPGEHTVVIIRNGNQSPTTIVKSNQEIVVADSQLAPDAYESNPSKWWKYFFSY